MNLGLLEFPCLGRPFHLGMLYDSRSETVIPGKTLWDSKVLQSNLQTRPKPYSNFEIIAEDSLQKKSLKLGIDAKLKLSFMGGLVQVSGAAKYIDDRKTSEQQARVTLKYTSTTHFEELTMEQIGSIQYPKVFDDVDATHVVSGVLYGSDAFFVFDRKLSASDNIRDVQGSLKVLVKAISGISEISGQASVDLKDTDKQKAEKISCKFYGDLILPSNPSTFEDAVRVYRDLPKLFRDGSGGKSVPKVVYLYPLSKLDGRPQRIIRSISNSLVSKIEKIMESFHNFDIKSSDIMKKEICLKFADIETQLSSFTELIERFKMDLVKKISELLPKIRGSGAEEKELADVISDVYSSPFSPTQMANYIKSKEREVKLLSQYLQNMSGEPKIKNAFSSSECEVLALTTDFQYDYIVCFAFNSTIKEPSYLNNLEEYLHTGKAEQIGEEWFENKDLLRSIKSLSGHFIEFVNTNSATENIAFAVTDHNEDSSGPSIILYVDSLPENFDPPGKPGKPSANRVAHESVNLTWSKPERGVKGIKSYKVFYTAETSDTWSAQSTDGKDTSTCIKGLLPNTKYHFKVQAVSEPGVSTESETHSVVTTKPPPVTRPADKMINFSRAIQSGPLTTYMLPLTKVVGNTEDGLFKFDVGSPARGVKTEKVLMVVGATGAGKSTLINGIANYVLGVEWKDNFRFKVISDEGESGKSSAHSQTRHITAYSFHCTAQPYVLTIVDTPGFGDTAGIEGDKRTAKQIKKFFSLPGSIDHITGIGFVTQAALPRLTPTQKYIFDAVLAKFGNDISDNIFFMITFADANEPPVLKAVQENDIYYKESFKFNNSAIFASNTDNSKFNSMFWEMGIQSFEDFFKIFSVAASKSLTLTREVLQEREQLETLLPGLQQQIKGGLAKLDEIEQEQRILKQHEDDIKANRNFEYEIDVHKHEKIPLRGVCTTNCLSCCFTCHEICIYSNNADKKSCSAMRGENCRVCPDKCHWTKHENTPFRYKYFDEMIRVKRTHENLKERYLSATSEKSKAENMISSTEVILVQLQAKVYKVVERTRRSMQRLKEIALKPNPLSEIEYLKLLVENEKEEQKSGWQRRVAMYEQLCRDAEILKKLPEIPISSDPKSPTWWRFW